MVWRQDAKMNQKRRNSRITCTGCAVIYLERNAQTLRGQDRREHAFGASFNHPAAAHCLHQTSAGTAVAWTQPAATAAAHEEEMEGVLAKTLLKREELQTGVARLAELLEEEGDTAATQTAITEMEGRIAQKNQALTTQEEALRALNNEKQQLEVASALRQRPPTTVGTSTENYTGQWQSNKRSGLGVVRCVNGDVYVGEWAAGERSGSGACAFGCGDLYEGEWAEDRMHGTGALLQISGQLFTGDFRSGRPHGAGRCHYADGSVYEGEFSEGEEEGEEY